MNETKEIMNVKEGELLEFAQQRRKQKQATKYLDYMNELLDFKDELEQTRASVTKTQVYVEKLLDRLNNFEVSQEEVADNIIDYLGRYDTKSWGSLIEKIEDKQK